MVTDIAVLNRLVEERVVQRFDRRDLREAFGTQSVTGEQLAEYVWTHLVSSLPTGKLSNVRLVQSRDLSFEYAG